MLKMVRSIISSVMDGAEAAIKRFSGSGRSDETFTNREYFQHYGFTSRPLSGAEGILIKDGNNVILIASDDRRYRLKVEDGEVALYTDEGDSIHLKRENEINITSGGKVIIKAPVVQLSDGQTLRKLIDERLVNAFNNHTHPTAGTGSPSKPTTPLVLGDVATAKTTAS